LPWGSSSTYACWMAPTRPKEPAATALLDGWWYSLSHASTPATGPPHRASGISHAMSFASHGATASLANRARPSPSTAASASGLAAPSPIGVARTMPSRPEPLGARATLCRFLPPTAAVALVDEYPPPLPSRRCLFDWIDVKACVRIMWGGGGKSWTYVSNRSRSSSDAAQARSTSVASPPSPAVRRTASSPRLANTSACLASSQPNPRLVCPSRNAFSSMNVLRASSGYSRVPRRPTTYSTTDARAWFLTRACTPAMSLSRAAGMVVCQK
jgi:hypothetical protein